MFSSSNNQDPFSKYKLQTYRFAFPFGTVITILYVIVVADASSFQFFLGIGMALVLFALSLSVWFGTWNLSVIELVFYFVAVSCFFALTFLSVESLISQDFLYPETLSDYLNSLGMWLVVFMVAGFLTLKIAQARLLLGFIFFGMTMLGIVNILFLYTSGQLNPHYLFRWINPLAALTITILLIQRMGVLQQQQASTDSLTGLMNRRALYRILESEMDRSARYKKSFAVILFDVDHFKAINDRHGHLRGDAVLTGLSFIISSAIRQVDSFGRWGGEEFLLILPETELESARVLAERLCHLLQQHPVGGVEHVTASFGVTCYRTGQTLEDLLHVVDHSMYRAKQNGRNQVVLL